MAKMIEDVKQVIKLHNDSAIDISEFGPKYIKKSFEDLEYITGKLDSIITELNK